MTTAIAEVVLDSRTPIERTLDGIETLIEGGQLDMMAAVTKRVIEVNLRRFRSMREALSEMLSGFNGSETAAERTAFANYVRGCRSTLVNCLVATNPSGAVAIEADVDRLIEDILREAGVRSNEDPLVPSSPEAEPEGDKNRRRKKR